VYQDLCVVERWRVTHGEMASTARAVRELQHAVVPGWSVRDSSYLAEVAGYCAAMLAATEAVSTGRPDGRALLDRLDSLSAAGPPSWPGNTGANLVIAALREKTGDVPRALAAVRRRVRGLPEALAYLPTYLGQEGRLAALVGDRAGAIAAYGHYLALRPNPEAEVQPEVEAVRGELAGLTSQTAR
jgi:hypothetical protein